MATASRPGGSQFIVLEDVNQLQVVLPFEESDAAQILPNQNVTVGFDAIPDLTRDGRVLSVAPSGTAISGIISYYVTVVLNDTTRGSRTVRPPGPPSSPSNWTTCSAFRTRRFAGRAH